MLVLDGIRLLPGSIIPRDSHRAPIVLAVPRNGQTPGYREKKWKFGGVTEFYLEENGPVRGSLLIRRHFLDSVLEQRICFYSHTARIDFKTKADWRESQLLLRTSFPLDIQSNEADFEIQFGNVKRPVHQNTTWDQARFEVCAHKWMDLSELTIACFKVFDLISVMTNGGPGRATNVLVYHIYNTAFINYEFGYASAISMVLFAIVLVITVVQFRAEKKWVSYM